MVFLAANLRVLVVKVMPKFDFPAGGSLDRTLVWMTAFIISLWGSGLRFLLLYPDTIWKVGLIGLAGFVVWVSVDAVRSVRSPMSG